MFTIQQLSVYYYLGEMKQIRNGKQEVDRNIRLQWLL